MAVTVEINPNQSIETCPRSYCKSLTADTNPTGVPIGSTLWDAQANIIYKTCDGTNWVVYVTLG